MSEINGKSNIDYGKVQPLENLDQLMRDYFIYSMVWKSLKIISYWDGLTFKKVMSYMGRNNSNIKA